MMVAVLLFTGLFNATAQNEDHPWLISVGGNAMDSYPTNVGDSHFMGQSWWTDEFFNWDDHWNVFPASLIVSRHVGDGFSLGIHGTYNKIAKYGDLYYKDAGLTEKLDYIGADGFVQYNFIKGKILDPYIKVGGGYTWIEEIGAGTLNGGLGLNVWVTPNLGLTLQSTYKHSFEDYLIPHFQHHAGLSYRFGGADRDGDGVSDKKDACPEVAGLKIFNGCPDSDNDGVEDSKDECPNLAGTIELRGCPDSDGDGITDNKDACPNEAGTKAMNGCPDKDGDSVADKEDNCPDEAGPKENKGCPFTDMDKDGVMDKDDACPQVFGTKANNGCPEVSEEIKKQINSYARTILFDTGKSTIKNESYSVLQDIVKIINEYPNARFKVEGHTDSVGSEKTNLDLSNRRAMAVRDYLVANGVDKFRLSAEGFGESMPIASNNTREGRSQNRRVEINLVK